VKHNLDGEAIKALALDICKLLEKRDEDMATELNALALAISLVLSDHVREDERNISGLEALTTLTGDLTQRIQDILAALPATTETDLRGALRSYINSQAYLTATVEGADRIDLNGTPSGAMIAKQANLDHRKFTFGGGREE
jgi:hypothetical protein